MGFFVAFYATPTGLVILAIIAVAAIAVLWTLFVDPRMSFMLGLSRLIDRVNEFIGKIVAWAIMVSILVSAGNAIVRKAFNMSSNAWLELQWYLFGAAFLLAAAYTLKQNEHIRIDIVYGMFSRRRQHWIDLLGHLFFLMPFVILMIAYFIPYFLLSLRSGEMSSSAGGLILWPAKGLLLIGFVQLGFQGISEIIKKVAILRGVMEDPNPFVSSHEQAQLDATALAEETRQLAEKSGNAAGEAR